MHVIHLHSTWRVDIIIIMIIIVIVVNVICYTQFFFGV